MAEFSFLGLFLPSFNQVIESYHHIGTQSSWTCSPSLIVDITVAGWCTTKRDVEQNVTIKRQNVARSKNGVKTKCINHQKTRKHCRVACLYSVTMLAYTTWKVRELPQFFITDDFSSVFGLIVTERDVWGTLWHGFHRSTKLFEASPRPLTAPLGFSLPVLPGSSSGPAWRRRVESAGNTVLRILQTFT